MPEYYVLVMPVSQRPFGADSRKTVLHLELCGYLYSRSYKRAIQEVDEYRDQINGGWDREVLSDNYRIAVASSRGTARNMRGFDNFKNRRVTDKKWDTRKAR